MLRFGLLLHETYGTRKKLAQREEGGRGRETLKTEIQMNVVWSLTTLGGRGGVWGHKFLENFDFKEL